MIYRPSHQARTHHPTTVPGTGVVLDEGLAAGVVCDLGDEAPTVLTKTTFASTCEYMLNEGWCISRGL